MTGGHHWIPDLNLGLGDHLFIKLKTLPPRLRYAVEKDNFHDPCGAVAFVAKPLMPLVTYANMDWESHSVD